MKLHQKIIIHCLGIVLIAFIWGYYFTYREYGMESLSNFNQGLKIATIMKIFQSAFWYLYKKFKK